MKARNSLLESVQLSPSRPAYRWKTASSDSMQRSVSVGCRNKSKFRRALLWARRQATWLHFWRKVGLRGASCNCFPRGVSSAQPAQLHFSLVLISLLFWHSTIVQDWGVVHGKSPGEMSAPIRGVSQMGKSLRCNHSNALIFSMLSSTLGLRLLFWKDKPACLLSLPLPWLDRGETLSQERKMRLELAPGRE